MKFYRLSLLLSLSVFTFSVFGQDCVNCPAASLGAVHPVVPQSPLELIPVRSADYERRLDVSYCKRPTEMIDSIVLHHSASSDVTSAESINATHTNKNNWHMVGYSYVVHSPYKGRPGSAEVTEGRPLEMIGAHAGSTAFVTMNPLQKRLWTSGKLTCGLEGQDFVVSPKDLMLNQKIKANATTIGVVVVGNYSKFSRTNSTGFSASAPHLPSEQTLDALARLSCQLQKKHPNIKNIKWHNFYKDASNGTACPGNLFNYIGDIKKKAKDYGCVFN